ncbi:hypothetical protein [Bradyrhizobium sp. BR 10261]|uniref:hypothetical protein n=1 Tax=Bradyrhizobium sp. BR 10261 TaxID=2749992 RepID=UPI001C6526E4|nr:hypothetical protein [Bradyrhizobium sp. BR 10261]MBW7967562.1 hypothetical protein [Bradyrhizobium sp. BR 10261]
MATDLYHRMLAYNYGDDERGELMRKVWSGHPWMVNAYTGGYSNDRDREHAIQTWCIENIGEPASPIHGKPGAWYRGSATINGWTWMGFTNEADMLRFIERWPAPDGVVEH